MEAELSGRRVSKEGLRDSLWLWSPKGRLGRRGSKEGFDPPPPPSPPEGILGRRFLAAPRRGIDGPGRTSLWRPSSQEGGSRRRVSTRRHPLSSGGYLR